jgi:hypothetical protein
MFSALAAAAFALAFVVFGVTMACIALALLTIVGFVDWVRHAR